jgi:hypothetical protein
MLQFVMTQWLGVKALGFVNAEADISKIVCVGSSEPLVLACESFSSAA